MDIPILYEDDVMVVVNKPPGVIVNNAQSVKFPTVQDWAAEKYPQLRPDVPHEELYRDFYDRAGIVHRIDKETSGILLIAKTTDAFLELQRQFKDREIHKTYMAIVHGDLVPQEGEISAPVDRLPWNRERFGIVPGGKESVTRYKTVQSVTTGSQIHKRGTNKHVVEKFSLVEVYPETGRTHQIRVHMKHIGHPLLGDYLYAGRKTSRDDRTWATRVMLHAYKLTCSHPVTHETLAFEAPIPDDMGRIINPTNNPI